MPKKHVTITIHGDINSGKSTLAHLIQQFLDELTNGPGEVVLREMPGEEASDEWIVAIPDRLKENPLSNTCVTIQDGNIFSQYKETLTDDPSNGHFFLKNNPSDPG